MLNGLAILIVEDEAFAAIALADAVEDLAGRAIGPVATVAEALAILEREDVAAAILDAHLADRDVTPLALLLVERSVPFVIYTGAGVPDALAADHPHLSVVRKPASAIAVLAALLRQVSPDHSHFAL